MCISANWCSTRVCFGSFTILYINDLNLAIKYCKVHHFADDTNYYIYTNNSIKKTK